MIDRLVIVCIMLWCFALGVGVGLYAMVQKDDIETRQLAWTKHMVNSFVKKSCLRRFPGERIDQYKE